MAAGIEVGRGRRSGLKPTGNGPIQLAGLPPRQRRPVTAPRSAPMSEPASAELRADRSPFLSVA
jgi:hypothetical protein